MSITVDIETMSTSDKVSLIGEIWDSIKEDTYSLPEWQIKILKNRIDEHEKNPNSGKPWCEIRRDLLNR